MTHVVEEPLLDPDDNPKIGGCRLAEWDDKTVCELEKLLTDNLQAHFKHAMKTIVGCGCKENDAETIILRSRVIQSNRDVVSSILTGALATLNSTKKTHLTEYENFENLESIVQYTLLEMICSLREVQPSLTVLEAMWLIFLWDFNLSNADTKLSAPLGSSSQAVMAKKNTETAIAKPAPGNPGCITYPIPKFALKHSVTGGQSIGRIVEPAPQLSKNSHVTGERVPDLYQRSAGEENPSCSRKLLSGIYKNEKFLQKEFLLQKTFKGHTSKGAFKARFIPLNSGSGPSGAVMKNSCSKISTSSGSVSEIIHHHRTDSTSLPPVAGTTPKTVKDADFYNPNSSAFSSYYAGIPYDTTLKKYIPQDEKDEAILELVPCLEKLQKIKEGWIEWANQKFQQGLIRIQNVKLEMLTVQKVIQEAEKAHINHHTKRHVEMEHAWASAVSRAEYTESLVRQLESENSALSLRMKSAEAKSLESARHLEKALQQEQIALKNSQSIDLEKRLLQEEFNSQKRNAAELESKLEKAKVCLKQFEDLWKKENKEKLKYLLEAESFRGRRKQLETLAKAEKKAIRERSRCEIQKCGEKIKQLEAEISGLKVEPEVSMIRTLQMRTVMDYGSSSMGSKSTYQYSGVHAMNDDVQRMPIPDFVEIDRKRERECVVCLSEERSVLFLPCTHQVVCTQCIMQHGKEMNECPSCRTPIQRRIQLRYYPSD